MKESTTHTDYKAIQEAGKHIDCSVSEADFNTNHPNPYRIYRIISDIWRYGQNVTGGM